MASWITRERSTARGLFVWVMLSIATLVVIFSSPDLLTEGSGNDWIGMLPFVSAGIGYLCYRNANPLTLLLALPAKTRDAGSTLISEFTTDQPSTGRGWIYGIAALVMGAPVLDATLGETYVREHDWPALLAVGAAALIGVAGAHQRNPLKLFGKIALFVAAAVLAIALLLLGYAAVSGFLTNYGIFGVIAILLLLILHKLDQLVRKR